MAGESPFGMKAKRLTASLLGLLLVLSAAACASNSNKSASTLSGSSKTSSGGNYTVLDIGALTGPVEPPAEAELQALKAAAANLNKSDGILGRHITIDSVD